MQGQKLLGWRTVPTDATCLGETARATKPFVRQLFIGRDPRIEDDTEFLARITNINFSKVNEKFKKVGKKIDRVHKDLKSETSQINSKIDAEVERKDDVDLRIKEVRTRVEVLEKQAL